MGKIELTGKVFSGQGGGKKFLELPWVRQQIQQKLGFTPYPGTLNLKLSPQSAQSRSMIEKKAVLKICPQKNYCEGTLFKAFVGAHECAVVIPKVENYPEDVLEVVASINLRDELRLKNGDNVTVTLDV